MATPTPPAPKNPKSDIQSGWKQLWSGTKKFFRQLTGLRSGLDKEGTIVNTRNNMRMHGANAWMLMCSIVIASIGLDQNSQAVIIGAMLISPLMSPILGIGLSVGINDFNSLRISLRHFGISIGIALVTSTLYFLITPFGEATEQIINRTAPTLLDAAIALFGGIAGIVSGSQKDKTNAIPGVAIATALMPPLCVTGFGLANLIKHGLVYEGFRSATSLNNFEIFINSFYLFFLNATLVAMATFVIVRLLQFPFRSFTNTKDRNRTNFMIFIFSFLIIIPSFFILRGVLRNVNTENEVKTVIEETFGEDLVYLDDWGTTETDSTASLTLKVYRTDDPVKLDEYKATIMAKLPDFRVRLIKSSELGIDRIQALEKRQQEMDKRDSLVMSLITEDKEKESAEVVLLKSQLENMARDTLLEKAVHREILATYDDYFSDCWYVHPIASDTVGLLILDWEKPASKAIEARVRKMVTARTSVRKLVIARQ